MLQTAQHVVVEAITLDGARPGRLRCAGRPDQSSVENGAASSFINAEEDGAPRSCAEAGADKQPEADTVRAPETVQAAHHGVGLPTAMRIAMLRTSYRAAQHCVAGELIGPQRQQGTG